MTGRYDFRAMRDNLRKGNAVTVAVAPQLFPTPPDVARRLVALLDLDGWAGEAWGTLRVLEPSAGTGNLIDAIQAAAPEAWVTAMELNAALAGALMKKHVGTDCNVMAGDFLRMEPKPEFDAVVMNPPFSMFGWEHHLRHAWRFVRPGGRLAAILPNAPSMKAVVTSLAPDAYMEELPADTFAGTSVRTWMVMMDKPEEVTE